MTAQNSNVTDRRLLDPENFGVLGKIFQINCDGVPQSGGGELLAVPPIQASELGTKYLQRTLKGVNNNASNQNRPSIITIAIEATVTTLGDSANSDDTILQGVLKFGTGAGQNGIQPGVDLIAGNSTLDGRLIFDLASGTMLSFPASSFGIDFLYTATKGAPGFAHAGAPVGPNYNVTFSLGYEPQSHTDRVTMTQLASTQDVAVAATVFFPRPKYATALYVTWNEWHTPTVSPVELVFYNGSGVAIFTIEYLGGGANGSNLPAIVPWPANALYMGVANGSGGGGATMSFLRVVNILDL